MFDNVAVPKGRIEALSDGVFAVVLTLLVIDLKPEHGSGASELLHQLRSLAPQLLGYAVTFAITCAFWFQHHCWLALLQRASRGTFWCNSLFLFAVTLLPFSVSMLLANGGTAQGAVLYYANMALIPTALALCWRHARRGALLAAEAPAGTVLRLNAQCWAFVAGGLAGSITALSSPRVAGLMYILPIIGFRIWARRPERSPAPTVTD